MAGNGYYDKYFGEYFPKSVETWDDYQASSAGDDWDSLTTWQGTPLLPLTFTSKVFDFGREEYLNYILDIQASNPADVTVRYGDTIDSAGGSIDSYSTISVTPNQSGLTAVKARYFQFVLSIDYADSAGDSELPVFRSVTANLSAERQTVTLTDIVSSTLSGSTGIRQLNNLPQIGSVSSIVVTPHLPVTNYVADSYVASGYIETAVTTSTPVIYIDKSTSPITLYIYDIDSYGKRKSVDCTFDAIVTGNLAMSSDATGSIRETV